LGASAAFFALASFSFLLSEWHRLPRRLIQSQRAANVL
jgi:hypothetical protein